MTTETAVAPTQRRTADQRERRTIQALASLARDPELSRRFLAVLDDDSLPVPADTDDGTSPGTVATPGL